MIFIFDCVTLQTSHTFFWLIRSLVDPTLAAFIVCGLLQFVLLNDILNRCCRTVIIFQIWNFIFKETGFDALAEKRGKQSVSRPIIYMLVTTTGFHK